MIEQYDVVYKPDVTEVHDCACEHVPENFTHRCS
jgi:hypothetical protein